MGGGRWERLLPSPTPTPQLLTPVSMKSIRVHDKGGPEVLKLEDLPDPTPGPGELLIDVEAVGMNFIEIYFREGLYPVDRPFTPGAEAAGTITALGAGVSEF